MDGRPQSVAFQRYATFAALAIGPPLAYVVAMAAMVSVRGDLEDGLHYLFIGSLPSMLYHWSKIILLAGAPAFTLLRTTRLPPAAAVLLALYVTSAGAAISALSESIGQCATAYFVRQSILERLNATDAATLRAVRTLVDDFRDEEGLLVLSGYCPHALEYTESGQVKHVTIHSDAAFHGLGPVR